MKAKLVLPLMMIAIVAAGCIIEPDYGFESDVRTFTGVVDPGQAVAYDIVIELDPEDARRFEEGDVSLRVGHSRPESALFGEVVPAERDEPQPLLFALDRPGSSERMHHDLRLGACRELEACRFEFGMYLGNIGEFPEGWELEIVVQREADGSRDTTVEIPSLTVDVAESGSGDHSWVVGDRVAFGEDVDAPAVYAIAIDTTLTDPSAFEVFITEPREGLITRNRMALVGADALIWALTYFDPDRAPVSSLAKCDGGGCHIDLIAIFDPSEQGDWWLPIAIPQPDPLGDGLDGDQMQIDVTRIEAKVVTGSLPADSTGPITIEIDAPLDATHALMTLWVYVEGDRHRPTLPSLVNPGSTEVGHYRWFPLQCAATCEARVTASWEIPHTADWEGRELSYWGMVTLGSPDRVGVDVLADVRVDEDS